MVAGYGVQLGVPRHVGTDCRLVALGKSVAVVRRGDHGTCQQRKLVVCTSTNPADNPEHQMTLGHSRHPEAAPFLWGRPPLVLRYVTTPAGSIAWRQTLADRQEAADRKATQDTEEQQRVRRTRP